MKIVFCGNSKILTNKNLETQIIDIILKNNYEEIECYLGGYGEFDNIALLSCQKIKQLHSNTKIYFVTPYIDKKYLDNLKNYLTLYDDIIYPPIEKTPKRYAILQRNYWMVKNADLVIAYVDYAWGGSGKTLEYAHKHNIPYINLGSKDFN